MLEDYLTPPVVNIFEYYFDEGKSMDEILDILFKDFFETQVINKFKPVSLTDQQENRILMTFPDDSDDEKLEEIHSMEN